MLMQATANREKSKPMPLEMNSTRNSSTRKGTRRKNSV